MKLLLAGVLVLVALCAAASYWSMQARLAVLEVIPCAEGHETMPQNAVNIDGQYWKTTDAVYVRRVDEERRIPNADPVTFAIIDDEFAKDATRVYYAGCELAGADPTSFSAIAGGTYGKDAAHVYWRWFPLPGADAATFVTLPWDYGKDARRVFYAEDIVSNTDPATFQSYDDQKTWCSTPGGEPQTIAAECYYNAEDKNHKYMLGKRVQ